MWKYLFYGIVLLIAIITVIVKIRTSQRYNIYMKYKSIINIYNEKLQEGLTNELVYQYIRDIDTLPKLDKDNEHKYMFVELYKWINEDDNISEDLKFQLKVSLSLKGIRV